MKSTTKKIRNTTRVLVPGVLGLLILSLAAGAQYHDAKYLSGSLKIHLTDGTGQVTELFDNPAALNGLTMDTDNRLVVFGDGGNAFGIKGLMRLDPVTRAVTTILSDSSLLYSPLDIIVNHDGDYVFTNRYSKLVTPTLTIHGMGLFKFVRSTSTVTTIATTLQAGSPGTWLGGLAADIDTGHYVVQDRNLAAGAPLLRMTDSGSIATISMGFSPRYSITQDIRTGDWYSSAGNQIMVLRTVSKSPTTLFAASSGNGLHTAIAFDRASAPRPRIVSRFRDTLYYIDPATAVVTSVALKTASATPWEMTFLRGRNLASVKTGSGKYDLKMSFPGEGGRGYGIAMSLKGVRPGVTLGDGRVINLAPDFFTTASIHNLMPGIWFPGPRVLDVGGEATARLDVSGIPKVNITCWIAALVVDGTGVGTIADPIVLRL